MKALEINELEVINGASNDTVSGFCAGYAMVAGAYAIGVSLNWWNPVGWAGGVVGGVVTIGCAVNSLT